MIDDSDFDLISKVKWHCNDTSNKHTKYAECYCRKNGKRSIISMHRFLLGLEDSKIKSDHIDGNGLNNQHHNLRVASNTQNGQNRAVSDNNKSGLKGVIAYKGKWRSHIKYDGETEHLGTFNSAESAAAAYDAAAIRHFGEFARTNASMGLLPCSA